jgi:hypothetical protein
MSMRELEKVIEPRFITVRELQSIGLDRAAAREMKALATRYEDNLGVQFMLADVYVRGGEPFKANGVLQRRFRQFVRHGGENIPAALLGNPFPLAYWGRDSRRGGAPRTRSASPRVDHPSGSGFEPTTVSNAGAGLMQIMPEEASRIGETGGLGAMTREDLDPRRTSPSAPRSSPRNSRRWTTTRSSRSPRQRRRAAVRDWMERTPPEDTDLSSSRSPTRRPAFT